MKLLYIGVCKENLEKYYPSYIKGEFLEGTFTEGELVNTIKIKNIDVLMIDVFHLTFSKYLLQQLKGQVKLINFQYQSIDSLIDLDEAKNCGIEVLSLPKDLYCNEVAEFAVTQLLCACKNMIQFDKSVKNGEWNQATSTNFTLRGKTLGVVGFGKIGRRIVELCNGWGMKILVTRKHLNKDEDIENVTFVNFPYLIENSHFIIFALPIKSDTFHMLNESHVEKICSNSIIVNISRGNIVDEIAIAKSLRSGKLHRYCADVFSHEPINIDHPLLKSEKTLLSPHIAWATEETLKKTFNVWFHQMAI
ncbi:2-hydroxyacid dehydrogenase [Nitrosomonas communis]|uniref:Glycerate dehydrogenase/D-3-phosphoglycerate dehydrogenase n=1 Tax=Nitrosomonas communis TaxID=44574 RepID=A0A1I4L2C8_9PROT|nr:2-hydroxyacid dehydrogenase [Nitrosomonas communis]SFL84827.1 glycerate dehydrogenase/D-3-phosphoglycerate dehydrogenase [Nitrosomonas communis]